MMLLIHSYFTVLNTNCPALYLFPNNYQSILSFSNLKWSNWIDAKLQWLAHKWKSIFPKENIIFSDFGVAALTESLWQAGICSGATLGILICTYWVYWFLFLFFPLLYCPPLTWYDYYKCDYDKNRYSINLGAMNEVSLISSGTCLWAGFWHTFYLAKLKWEYRPIWGPARDFYLSLSTKVTVKQWAVVL